MVDRRSFLRMSAGSALLVPVMGVLGLAPTDVVRITGPLPEPGQALDLVPMRADQQDLLRLAQGYRGSPLMVRLDGVSIFVDEPRGSNIRWYAAPGEEIYVPPRSALALVFENDGRGVLRTHVRRWQENVR